MEHNYIFNTLLCHGRSNYDDNTYNEILQEYSTKNKIDLKKSLIKEKDGKKFFSTYDEYSELIPYLIVKFDTYVKENSLLIFGNSSCFYEEFNKYLEKIVFLIYDKDNIFNTKWFSIYTSILNNLLNHFTSFAIKEHASKDITPSELYKCIQNTKISVYNCLNELVDGLPEINLMYFNICISKTINSSYLFGIDKSTNKPFNYEYVDIIESFDLLRRSNSYKEVLTTVFKSAMYNVPNEHTDEEAIDTYSKNLISNISNIPFPKKLEDLFNKYKDKNKYSVEHTVIYIPWNENEYHDIESTHLLLNICITDKETKFSYSTSIEIYLDYLNSMDKYNRFFDLVSDITSIKTVSDTTVNKLRIIKHI